MDINKISQMALNFRGVRVTDYTPKVTLRKGLKVVRQNFCIKTLRGIVLESSNSWVIVDEEKGIICDVKGNPYSWSTKTITEYEASTIDSKSNLTYGVAGRLIDLKFVEL